MSLFCLDNISYTYAKSTKPILNGITANFEAGKMYAVIGKSGAGKTTLLSLISGLDVCTEGTVYYNGQDLKNVNRDKYRASKIGVIFQSYNLLNNATALENIILAMNLSGDRTADKKTAAYSLLEKVGIDKETADRKILKLSGGEQQRIGIARALSHNPDILIADEPASYADEVLGLSGGKLVAVNQKKGASEYEH